MNRRYLHMITHMKKGGRREWTVYILRCGDGSLYTGISKDVHARLKKHQSGAGAAYTRTHLPVNLIYIEPRTNRSRALKREAELKKLPREKKLALVERTPYSAIPVAVNG